MTLAPKAPDGCQLSFGANELAAACLVLWLVSTRDGKSLVDLADLIAIKAAERIALGRDGSAKNVDQDAMELGVPLALRRVLTNLVDNAIKFSRDGIEISFHENARFWRRRSGAHRHLQSLLLHRGLAQSAR